VTRRTWSDTSRRSQTRFDATFRGPGGRKRTRTFRRLGDAQRWLDAQRDAKHRAAWIDPRRGSERLEAFYGRWRERAAENGQPTERTLLAYDEIFGSLIRPILGSRALASIARTDVEAVVRSAAERSAWRAHDALKVLRRILSAAVDAEAIVRNPAARVAAPRIEQAEPWVLTPEEVDRLVEAMPDRYRALVLLAAYGGLRWSELVALRLDRMDLPRRRVRVEEKIVEAGHLITGEPKTKRSRRWVTLPEFVTFALAEHVRRFPPGDDGLVFTAPEGGPLRRHTFRSRVWTKATAAAGLEGFSFRHLRHTGATMALASGVSPVLVAFRLGHASTRMIEQHYGRLLESMDAEIAGRLDAAREPPAAQRAEPTDR
jgi:integrase